MRTVQLGDRAQVHYRICAQDGSSSSSRGRAPLSLVAGTAHPRLPGLGVALVGLAPGALTRVRVPAGEAFGEHDPGRIRRWARSRFAEGAELKAGTFVVHTSVRGRRRRVRIVEVNKQGVVVDTNHRWAGQSVELEVELLAIEEAGTSADGPNRSRNL
jgi:peptidylprolyl isomerase